MKEKKYEVGVELACKGLRDRYKYCTFRDIRSHSIETRRVGEEAILHQ